MRVEQANTIKLLDACAAVVPNEDSLNLYPAAMKEQPSTRRMLERIDPNIDV